MHDDPAWLDRLPDPRRARDLDPASQALIVTRAATCTALGFYGAVHLAQAVGRWGSQPGWLVWGFAVSAGLAGLLSLALVAAPLRRAPILEAAALVLAVLSAGALLGSVTVGLGGLAPEGLQGGMVLALLSEAVVAATVLYGRARAPLADPGSTEPAPRADEADTILITDREMQRPRGSRPDERELVGAARRGP